MLKKLCSHTKNVETGAVVICNDSLDPERALMKKKSLLFT